MASHHCRPHMPVGVVPKTVHRKEASCIGGNKNGLRSRGQENGKNDDYCGSTMVAAYFLIGGGVWCCEDKEFMEHRVAGDTDKYEYKIDEKNSIITPPKPLHCVIGNSGWHSKSERWPKEGLFCKQCYTFVVKPLPR